MTEASHLKQRVGRRYAATQGLTIIELLLSVTLLVLITGFLAGGLQVARRAFDADRRAAADAEIDQAVTVLTNQIASAFPLTDTRSGALNFDGGPNGLTFVSLDQGRANRGGLKHAVIRRVGTDLTIAVTSLTRRQADDGSERRPIVLLGRVADVQFSYFGVSNQKAAPAWSPEWSEMDRLPDLVSVRLDWKEARAPTTVLVALRQRR
jgi:type II secretory pathway component PulJ